MVSNTTPSSATPWRASTIPSYLMFWPTLRRPRVLQHRLELLEHEPRGRAAAAPRGSGGRRGCRTAWSASTAERKADQLGPHGVRRGGFGVDGETSRRPAAARSAPPARRRRGWPGSPCGSDPACGRLCCSCRNSSSRNSSESAWTSGALTRSASGSTSTGASVRMAASSRLRNAWSRNCQQVFLLLLAGDAIDLRVEVLQGPEGPDQLEGGLGTDARNPRDVVRRVARRAP